MEVGGTVFLGLITVLKTGNKKTYVKYFFYDDLV